jgi:tetratricopeptide (TPR) repeat protein
MFKQYLKYLTKKNIKIILPIFLFFLVFGAYLYTSPRVQVSYADADEVMTAAYTLGVPHPPGYPLFAILGKLFTFLPMGTIAFRFSIFSSVCGALTALFVYLTIFKILEELTKRKEGEEKPFTFLFLCLASSIGALSLAFSYTFWLYSIVPEVFCLSNFFTGLLLYLLVFWYFAQKEGKGKSYPYLVVFSFTLAFLAHQILLFLAPAILILVWLIDKKIFIFSKRWLGIFAATIAGLLPLFYLPWAALKKPELDYGHTVNLAYLWEHITRAVYRQGPDLTSAYIPSQFNLRNQLFGLFKYFSFLTQQFTLIIFIIGLIGLVFLLLRRKNKAPGLFVFLAFLFSGPGLAFYSWVGSGQIEFNSLGAQERMVLSSFIVFSVFVGCGVFLLFKLIEKLELDRKIAIPLSLLFLIIPLCPLRSNFSVVNKRNFTLGHDFAENLFLNIEPNGILFTKGDRPTFTAQYYQLVEKKRLDVTVLSFGAKDWNIEKWREKEPDLFKTENPTLLAVMRDIITRNIDKRPIYITGLPKDMLIQMGLTGNPYVVSPRGIICQVTKDFDTGQGYFEKLVWHGPQNVDFYYDWYAKELIEQYIIGLSNNYFHLRLRGYLEPAKEEFFKMRKIAPDHPLSKRVADDFLKFSQEKATPQKFVVGQAKEHFEMARSYLNDKKVAEAMSEYWMAVYLEPSNNLYRLQLGGSYEVLGWYEEAYEQYKHILANEKKDKLVLQKAKERIIVAEYLANK